MRERAPLAVAARAVPGLGLRLGFRRGCCRCLGRRERLLLQCGARSGAYSSSLHKQFSLSGQVPPTACSVLMVATAVTLRACAPWP